MNTGITIRVMDKEMRWRSFDLGDPELPFDQLVLWLASKDADYLSRLILMLLGRSEEGGM